MKKYMKVLIDLVVTSLYRRKIKQTFSEFYSEEESVHGTDCLQIDIWGNINPYCQGEMRSQYYTYVYRSPYIKNKGV